MQKPIIALTSLCLLLALASVSLADDISGANDHPLISRYPGSSIIFNAVNEFEEYRIPMSTPYRVSGRDYAAAQSEIIEGKVTRLVYATAGSASNLQIYKNYLAALEQPGFSIIRRCQGANCEANAKTFGRFLKQRRVSYKDKAEAYFIAAKYKRDGAAPVYFVVLSGQTNSGNSQIIVDIVETTEIELGKISTNVDALAESLAQQGRAAIYDIFFDTGESVVKSESRKALEAIAGVLSLEPGLTLYVVGHTDDTGSVATNTKLANERAIAIVRYLNTELGVTEDRLYAAGAGPFAPVAPNDTVEGRVKNRRVEVVKRYTPIQNNR